MPNIAQSCVELATQKNIKITFAESCTGGALSAALTDISGASKVFERAFITYSNCAKHELLDVPNNLFEHYGAVSEPVAKAMAQGALKAAKANIALSITGIAGPQSDDTQKPVGLVYIALTQATHTTCACHTFGDLPRAQIRALSVEAALKMLQQALLKI